MQQLSVTARPDSPRIALVLLGGGARSAYQVGVLKAISQWCPPGQPLPFRLLCGTSAGAILAAVLATHARSFRGGTVALERVWRNFHVGQIFRDDRLSMMRGGLHLLLALASGGWLLPPPRSLLVNRPLRRLLEWGVNFARLHGGFCRAAFQNLEPVCRYKDRFARLIHPVIGPADALQTAADGARRRSRESARIRAAAARLP